MQGSNDTNDIPAAGDVGVSGMSADSSITDESRPLTVLLVGMNPDVSTTTGEALIAHFGPETHIESATPADVDGLDVSPFGIALLGVGDNADARATLDGLLRRKSDLPVVLVSDQQGRGSAIEGTGRAAYDNLVTVGNYLVTLPWVVEKNLAIWKIRRENELLQAELAKTIDEVQVKNKQLEHAVTQLESIALTDPLTGLHNRRSFGRSLDQNFALAERYTHDLTFLMVDLDNFKRINDTFGHQQGDEVLQMAARVLEANCRRSDLAGRFGGDEFVIILPQTSMVTAFKVAKRIRADFGLALKAKFLGSDSVPDVAMSIGGASMRQSKPEDPEQMISFADQALYTAKQSKITPIVAYAKPVKIKAVPVPSGQAAMGE